MAKSDAKSGNNKRFASGRSVPTRHRVRIRPTQQSGGLESGLHHTASLSRSAAIAQAVGHLRRASNHPAALALIDLFQLDGEELLEAGACYETVTGLRLQFPLLGSLN